jgi:phenylpropionate dioxygenase-like ring-hydroxylating dioxygenase large terminal subunit
MSTAEQTQFTRTTGLDTAPVPLEPYRSQAFFELERDRIFRRSWLMLARVEEVAAAGDFIVKGIPTVGVSVLITRTADGEVHAFYNSCSHRGSEVVAARQGRANRFLCPYHNWAYSNDGRLIAIPDSASFFNVDRANCGLSTIACEIWEGFIFVSLQRDPEISLLQFLGPFANHLQGLHYQAADNPIILTAQLDANWKVVCDAFIETYHIPVIHPQTIGATFSSRNNPFARLLDAKLFGPHRAVSMYGNPDYVFNPTDRVQHLAYSKVKTGNTIAAASVEDAAKFLQHPAINPTRSPNWSMDVNHLFPHTQIDCGPGGFWTHQFWPTSPRTCNYEVRFYVPRATNVRERFQQELYVSRVIEVVLEDLNNVARTQRGIDTGGKDCMQLQDSEIGIRHHMQQVLKWVAAGSVTEALA